MLVADHFGPLDVPVKQMSLTRFAGATLIIVSVILIRKF